MKWEVDNLFVCCVHYLVYVSTLVQNMKVAFFFQVHFRRIIAPHTDVNLGDCSFLDTCRHMKVNFVFLIIF